jgi:glycosyltransferase involved in cell wall biosynthesis
MLRALATLEGAAGAHGWTLDYVLAGPPAPAAAGALPAARVHVLGGLAGWRRLPAGLGMPLTVARLARIARGADVLYACTLSSFPVTALAGRIAGVPQVVHVYSSYGDPRPYRKHWLGLARHVIAPSADSLALAARAVGGFDRRTRARVAYNGIDVDAVLAAAGAAPPPGPPTIGMVGHLDWRKNPALLVDAAARIRRRVPDLRVLLVGAFRAGRYEHDVRERVRALGLDDAVAVTGFLANPFPVVRGLDVVVHPAQRDPFPLALLEAMALARPIVATAVGGIPEMLVDGESGLLVPPEDAPALADAVTALLLDPARRARMGAAAYERLTTEFTLARFAATMFGAFAAAAGERGR